MKYEFIKKNLDIIFGIFMPILLIIMVISYILLLPKINNEKRPQYNFIYFQGDYLDRNKILVNKNNNLILSDNSILNNIRFYDVKNKSYRKINSEELSLIKIDTSSRSPDGYKIKNGERINYDLFFIFDSSYIDYTKIFLSKNKYKELIEINFDYYRDFMDNNFIGWVIN